MKGRCEHLRRSLSLSRKLWRLQVARLAYLEATLTELRTGERDGLEALERGQVSPALVLHRLRALTVRRQEAEAAHRVECTRLLEHARRMKQIERLHQEAETLWRRDLAAAELRALGERPDVRAP